MMGYEFPPPVPMSIGIPVFLLYLLLLTFALAACFRVFDGREPLSSSSRIRRSGIGLGIAALICVGGLIFDQTRGRLQQYLDHWAIFVALLALMSLSQQIRRCPHEEKGSGLIV